MAEDITVGLGPDAVAILGLAELEARRAGSAQVEVRHVALALAAHPRWGAPFAEMQITHDRLRAVVMEAGQRAAAALPPAPETVAVFKRAGKLLGPGDKGVDGRHVLRAILESQGAVAQAIARESGVPLDDLLNKPELLALPVHLGLVESAKARTLYGLKRLAMHTVRAFAWSGLWAGILYLLMRWALGPETGGLYFGRTVLIIGAACAVGCAAVPLVKRFRPRGPFNTRRHLGGKQPGLSTTPSKA